MARYVLCATPTPAGGAGSSAPWSGSAAESSAVCDLPGVDSTAVTLARQGTPLPVDETALGRCRVYPFLFDCDHRDLSLGEHACAEWVSPTAIADRETVSRESYDRVRPRVETVVVAASDEISPDTGRDTEEREPGELSRGDAPVRVWNPTFDLTPPAVVDTVVTERGALDTRDVEDIAAEHRALRDWTL